MGTFPLSGFPVILININTIGFDIIFKVIICEEGMRTREITDLARRIQTFSHDVLKLFYHVSF
jgi:hypothetical protein